VILAKVKKSEKSEKSEIKWHFRMKNPGQGHQVDEHSLLCFQPCVRIRRSRFCSDTDVKVKSFKVFHFTYNFNIPLKKLGFWRFFRKIGQNVFICCKTPQKNVLWGYLEGFRSDGQGVCRRFAQAATDLIPGKIQEISHNGQSVTCPTNNSHFEGSLQVVYMQFT
jgi:hypothetical protein